MAAINFVKGEQYYTAEFQINGPVNIHIERAEAGALYFRQRSIDHGSYDLINGANWNNRGDLTIDTAIQGVVYPMWIKIESASEPTLAEMVEGEQSGGGAGTAEPAYEYYKVDWDGIKNDGYITLPATSLKEAARSTFEILRVMTLFAGSISSSLLKVAYMGEFLEISYSEITEDAFPYLKQGCNRVAFLPAKTSEGDNLTLRQYLEGTTGSTTTIDYFTPITKEQFYNLEA